MEFNELNLPAPVPGYKWRIKREYDEYYGDVLCIHMGRVVQVTRKRWFRNSVVYDEWRDIVQSRCLRLDRHTDDLEADIEEKARFMIADFELQEDVGVNKIKARSLEGDYE